MGQALDLPVRHQPAPGDDRGGHMPRAAQDAPRQHAGIADEVGPGQEGAHGVAEEEIGLPRKDPGRLPPQGLDVVHDVPPAVLVPQVDHGPVRDPGQAVAQVVVGRDGEAVLT